MFSASEMRLLSDWLESDEFRAAMKAFWQALPWHSRIDLTREIIREHYKPPDNSRTVKALRKELAEAHEWINKLTEGRCDDPRGPSG